jgi:hypothetical protein
MTNDWELPEEELHKQIARTGIERARQKESTDMATAKKEKGGVIKQVIDGVAAKKKEKNKAGKSEIEVEIVRLEGQPEDEKVMVDGELPGMETEKDPDLIRAGKAYNSVKKQRMKLTITEVERKALLISMMHDRKLTHYRYGKLTIDLETSEKLRVSEDDDE